MRNLLVTGGAGFIGANFVHHILATYPDYRVVVFDKLTYAGNLDNLKSVEADPRYAFVQGDIADREVVREAIRRYDIDTVVNFAAETHVDRSILDPDAFVHTNVYGPHVLCSVVQELRLERLHHISSVTGDTPLLVRDERTGDVALRPIETLDGLDLRDFSVLTLDAGNEVRFAGMHYFVKHPVDELYEITYNGGGRVRATREHSVFVFDGADIVAKPSEQLRPGDLLVTFLGDVEQEQRVSHRFDLRSVLADYTTQWMPGSLETRQMILAVAQEPVRAKQLFAAAPSTVTGYRAANELVAEGHLERVGGLYRITEQGIIDAAQGMVATRWNMVKRQLHLPFDELEVTPLLMEVFGLYIAEGHAAHTPTEQVQHACNVTFTIGLEETEELALLQRCAEEVFGIRAYVQQRESSYQVTYSSAWVHRLFSQFGSTAETKTLPTWIWTQPRALIVALFKGYEGDARVREDGQRCYTSINRALIEQLVWLGRLYNRNTRMSPRTVQQVAHAVPPGCTVTRERTFYDLSVSAEDARQDEAGGWRTPMARCLPAEPVAAALQTGVLAHQLRKSGKRLVGKSRLQQELARRDDCPSWLARLAGSAVGVAEIRSVQRITGQFMVYDVSVPHCERFFGGNVPVLLHNTDEVYGPIPQGKFKETDSFKPTSPYAASKAGGELIVLAYYQTYGLPVTVTRGVNTYGPYQYPEKAIPLFVTNAIDDQPIPLYGDGTQVRDRLHALDHARAVDVVLHRGKLGEAYNVAADMEQTNIDVARRILRLLNKPEALIQPVLDRPAHDVRYALDAEKLGALGWEPQVVFEQGLEETVRWFQQNEEWWRPLKSGEYLDYYRRQYTDRAQTLDEKAM